MKRYSLLGYTAIIYQKRELPVHVFMQILDLNYYPMVGLKENHVPRFSSLKKTCMN